MLILSRKQDERIITEDGLVITVIEIRGDRVRLGIEDPHGRTIHREEIWDIIRKEQGDGKGE